MFPNLLKEFNWVDAVVLIFIIRGIFRGAKNGFVLEVLSLSGWCVALYLALKFYKTIASTLHERTEIPLVLNEVFIFGGIIITTILLANFLGQILKRIVRIKVVERISFYGGAIFGVLKACVILSALFYFLGILGISYINKSIQERSLSGRAITKLASVVYRNLGAVIAESK
ncbi:MAG: CvpA family protein [Candidatus Omnitrophica bacterium]|nr:CvpA family protein [Candidatus Omnitrophota bacterium]